MQKRHGQAPLATTFSTTQGAATRLDAEPGNAVVVQLGLVQRHLVVEQDRVPRQQWRAIQLLSDCTQVNAGPALPPRCLLSLSLPPTLLPTKGADRLPESQRASCNTALGAVLEAKKLCPRCTEHAGARTVKEGAQSQQEQTKRASSPKRVTGTPIPQVQRHWGLHAMLCEYKCALSAPAPFCVQQRSLRTVLPYVVV